MALWQRTDVDIWHLSGSAAAIVYVLGAASWLWYWQLHVYEYDCGLAFGSSSLVAALAHRESPSLTPWKVGSRRWIRFPVHTAFFPMFFAVPHMTADLFVLAVVINVYNVIGSVLYDVRLERLSGEPYFAYQRVTGLIWPPVYRARQGAGDLALPAPAHWRHPARHVPGVLAGLGLGALYWWLLGSVDLTAMSMLGTGLVGLLGALLVGVVLGRSLSPDPAVDWAQRQTDVSTTVAVAAATGVASWAGIGWLTQGAPPAFAVYLPLWFTVQYLGHVFAVLVHRRRWLDEAAAGDAGQTSQPGRPGQSVSPTVVPDGVEQRTNV
ncbi:MAG TPA: hypothetical protein VFX70_21660 [Mycobacteriales bacterium]|nr:hypothetical protein [Mycobacteriales bacterium]